MFRKKVNLVDIALQWLRALAGISPSNNLPYEILRYHPHSIRAIYGIATVLYKLLHHKGIDRFIDDKAGYKNIAYASDQEEDQDSVYNSEKEKESLGEVFKFMTPCDTYYKRYLLKATMGIGEDEYDYHHIKDERVESESFDEGHGDLDEDFDINNEKDEEENLSEDDGVLLFDDE